MRFVECYWGGDIVKRIKRASYVANVGEIRNSNKVQIGEIKWTGLMETKENIQG